MHPDITAIHLVSPDVAEAMNAVPEQFFGRIEKGRPPRIPERGAPIVMLRRLPHRHRDAIARFSDQILNNSGIFNRTQEFILTKDRWLFLNDLRRTLIFGELHRVMRGHVGVRLVEGRSTVYADRVGQALLEQLADQVWGAI